MIELGDQDVLWEEFKKGNQSAFATLYHRLYSPLYFYALKATTDCFKSLRGIIRRSQSRQYNQTQLIPDQTSGWAFSPEDFMIRQEEDAYR